MGLPARSSRFLFLLAAFTSIFCPFSTSQAQQTIPEKQKALWQKMDQNIQDVTQNVDGVMGVMVEDLASNQTFTILPDEVFPTASSIKIAVLADLYLQAQQGKLKLTDMYTVQKSDLIPDSDIMGGLTPGLTKITLHDLATMMVAVSDNSATNVLIDRVGMENVNALLDSLGLTHTRLRRKMMDLKAASEGRENVATPRELGKLLELIYRGKVLNQPYTDDFFTMLSTHKESFIPRNFPDGLKIANKPGELEGVRNDIGLVFLQNHPYIVSVMSCYLRNGREGEDAISKISLLAYRTLDRLDRASEYGRVISPANSGSPR